MPTEESVSSLIFKRRTVALYSKNIYTVLFINNIINIYNWFAWTWLIPNKLIEIDFCLTIKIPTETSIYFSLKGLWLTILTTHIANNKLLRNKNTFIFILPSYNIDHKIIELQILQLKISYVKILNRYFSCAL